MNRQKKLNKNHSHLYMMGVTSHSYLSVGQGIKMKATAEQIKYLENNIEMVDLDIIEVKAHIKGGVWGNVGGFVWGTVKGEEVI